MHNNIPDKNILQSYPASCAIKCQQIILRDYGIDVSEEDLCRVAKENGWYDEKVGVYMHDNGKLLGCFGIGYHHSQGNDIAGIESEIRNTHRVMVNINHAKLAGKHDRNGQACHAVIVYSLVDDSVFVINPSTGINESYSKELFEYAWKDSDNYMLATDSRAVFEYDHFSNMMIEI